MSAALPAHGVHVFREVAENVLVGCDDKVFRYPPRAYSARSPRVPAVFYRPLVYQRVGSHPARSCPSRCESSAKNAAIIALTLVCCAGESFDVSAVTSSGRFNSVPDVSGVRTPAKTRVSASGRECAWSGVSKSEYSERSEASSGQPFRLHPRSRRSKPVLRCLNGFPSLADALPACQ